MPAVAELQQVNTIETLVNKVVAEWWREQPCPKVKDPRPEITQLQASRDSYGLVEASFTFTLPPEFNTDQGGKYRFSHWTDLEDLYLRLQTCPGMATTHWKAAKSPDCIFTVEYSATIPPARAYSNGHS